MAELPWFLRPLVGDPALDPLGDPAPPPPAEAGHEAAPRFASDYSRFEQRGPAEPDPEFRERFIPNNSIWRRGASVLSMVPGPVGLVGRMASLGINANNLGWVADQRRSLGMAPMSVPETVGGLIGGDASRGYVGRVNIAGRPQNVAYGGVMPRGALASIADLLGLGGGSVGAYTPGEARLRQSSAALRGGYERSPRGGESLQERARRTGEVRNSGYWGR